MDTITKIKQNISFPAYVARHTKGLKPSDRTGRYYLGYCPFCQPDKSTYARRKFWVDTELNICNCFSPKCKSAKPMDIINFYARLNHTSDKEAIAALNTI